MVTSTTDIQTGMEVYTSDGEKLGEVKEVYPQTGDAGEAGDFAVEEVVVAEVVPDDLVGAEAEYGTVVLEAVGVPTEAGAGSMPAMGYVKVQHGGILGIGAKDLYIPFAAVTEVVPGDRLTVNCVQDECTKQYETKPAFIERQDNKQNGG